MDKTPEQKQADALAHAYRGAGEKYMVTRLSDIFCIIDSDEKRVLHNAMIKELNIIINSPQRHYIFLKAMYDVLTIGSHGGQTLPPMKKRNMLQRAAKWIMNFVRKGK